MATTYKNKKHNKSIKSSTTKNNKTKKNRNTTSSNQLIIKKNHNVNNNLHCEEIPAVKGLKALNTYLIDVLPKLTGSGLALRSKFANDILLSAAPKNIKQNDDYYTFVNYSWINETHTNNKQTYITQIDDFRLTQDKVYKDLHEIIMSLGMNLLVAAGFIHDFIEYKKEKTNK